MLTSNWLELKNTFKWDKEGDYIMIKVKKKRLTNMKCIYPYAPKKDSCHI